jgi:hypothetical protein
VRAEYKQSDPCYIDHDYPQSLLTAEQKCVQAIDIDEYYRNLRFSGVFFGPTMQNVTEMKVSPCGSHILGNVRIPVLAEHMPAGYTQSHIVHPTTMESMAQMLLPICTSDKAPLGSELLTTFMEEIWISASIDPKPGKIFRTYAQSKQKTPSQWNADMEVWDDTTRQRQIVTRRIELSALSQKEASPMFYPCYSVRSELCTDLITSATAFRNIHKGLMPHRDLTASAKLQLLSAMYILEAHSQVQRASTPVHPNQRKLYDWICETVSALESGSLPCVDITSMQTLARSPGIKAELESSQTSGAWGLLLVEVGKTLADILSGRKDPGDFRNLLERANEELQLDEIEPLLLQYLAARGRDHSHLKVMELNAGRARDTSLSALGSSVDRYVVANCPEELLQEAKLQLEETPKLEFSTLDIESEPESQGRHSGAYDMVIARNVCSAFGSAAILFN